MCFTNVCILLLSIWYSLPFKFLYNLLCATPYLFLKHRVLFWCNVIDLVSVYYVFCIFKYLKILIGSKLEVDYCIITIPLGCLKDDAIKFTPELPDWKTESIHKLGFGHLNKLVIEFDRSFWPQDCDFFGSAQSYHDKEIGQAFMFWNIERFTEKPILSALISGEAAE